MNPTGYVYMPFIVGHKDTSDVIYASVYWKDHTPVFACLAGAFESSKGEFRDNFCRYTQVNKVFREQGKILNQIVDELMKKYNKHEF